MQKKSKIAVIEMFCTIHFWVSEAGWIYMYYFPFVLFRQFVGYKRWDFFIFMYNGIPLIWSQE